MEQKAYNIKIHGIELIEKSLYRATLDSPDVFNFQTTLQSLLDHTQQMIVYFVSIEIKNIKSNNLVGKIMAGVGFVIEDFEQVFLKDKKEQYIIPDDLENMLKTISISTMRGIMFSEFRGTQLHKAVLPIIMANSFQPLEGNMLTEAD
jgi:hypothetical protein